MIMCYHYNTHQCAGGLQYLQGKDHSKAFNTGDQHAVAFMLCFRLPGQSEVGPQRVERAKCCHQPSPLLLVCSHMDTNGDHGADYQRNTHFVLEEASHSREKYWLHKDWANPTVNGCLETTSQQMKTVLIQYSLKRPQSCAWYWKCLLCQVRAHSEWKICYQAIWRYNWYIPWPLLLPPQH